MANNYIEDEFDALPDVFEGIDWDRIPALTQQQPQDDPGASSSIEHNAQHNLTPRVYSSGTISHHQPGSASSSEDYGLDDLDESFLGEVDALERRMTMDSIPAEAFDAPMGQSGTANTRSPSRSSAVSPRPLAPSNGLLVRSTSTGVQPSNISPKKTPRMKRPASDYDSSPSPRKKVRTGTPTSRSISPAKTPSRNSKGKGKGRDMHDGVKRVLEGFEDELSCPICFEIFAYAHLGNPCGHSFCGECGYNWISKTKRKPTCSACRAELAPAAPMIPNFALDNTIEKHIQALAASGVEDWKETGDKYKDWLARKESWKVGTAQRAAEAKSISHVAHIIIDEEDEGDASASSSGPENDQLVAYIVQETARQLNASRGRGGRRRNYMRNNGGGSNRGGGGGNGGRNHGRGQRGRGRS